MVSKFIKQGKNKEDVWEQGNIGQFWKGTRTLPGRPSEVGVKVTTSITSCLRARLCPLSILIFNENGN